MEKATLKICYPRYSADVACREISAERQQTAVASPARRPGAVRSDRQLAIPADPVIEEAAGEMARGTVTLPPTDWEDSLAAAEEAEHGGDGRSSTIFSTWDYS